MHFATQTHTHTMMMYASLYYFSFLFLFFCNARWQFHWQKKTPLTNLTDFHSFEMHLERINRCTLIHNFQIFLVISFDFSINNLMETALVECVRHTGNGNIHFCEYVSSIFCVRARSLTRSLSFSIKWKYNNNSSGTSEKSIEELPKPKDYYSCHNKIYWLNQ